MPDPCLHICCIHECSLIYVYVHTVFFAWFPHKAFDFPYVTAYVCIFSYDRRCIAYSKDCYTFLQKGSNEGTTCGVVSPVKENMLNLNASVKGIERDMYLVS